MKLTRKLCVKALTLTVPLTLSAGTQEPCAAHRCPYGGVCRSSGPGSEPRCDCPRCGDEYSPVCATDGTSYNNECKLRLEACEKRLDLRVQYIGLCSECGALWRGVGGLALELRESENGVSA